MAYGKWAAAWAVVSLALTACGNSKGDPAKDGVSSKEELAAKLAQLSCGSRAPCCEEQGFAFDEAQCSKNYGAFLLERGWKEGETAGGTFDAVQANDCLAQYEALQTCGNVEDTGGALEACDYAIHGDVAPGEPCESHLQCAVGRGQTASCGEDGVCVVFTLQQATHGRSGDTCRTTCARDECLVEGRPTPSDPEAEGLDVGCYRSDGVYCRFNGVCEPLAELGEPCDGHESCVDGAYCPPATLNGSVCTEKLEDGADCSANPSACRSGYCDEATWQCRAPALPAEECSDSI